MGAFVIRTHVLIAAGYTALSAALAVLLPYLVPMLQLTAPIVIGVVLVMLFAFLHAIVARGRRLRWMEAELEGQRERLTYLETEIRALRTEQGKSGSGAMLAEVKVLQSLLKQLNQKRPAAEATAPAAGTKAAPPAARLPAARVELDDDAVLDIVEEALRDSRIDLFLQPIVDLPQRRPRFYECFTRIRSGDGTLITPERYISIAEEAGLVSTNDNMLLFRAVQILRQRRPGKAEFGFLCNISNHSLTDVDFFNQFIEFLSEHRSLAHNLIFEFAQPDIRRGDAKTEHALAQLAHLGFRFSLDQTYDLDLDLDGLSRRGFKFIKVEATLLLDALKRRVGSLDMADFKRRLNRHAMDLIVEKIETEDELRELLDYGVDFGQGYLFGEPKLSADAA
ncbi:MAG: EAL domain-containing protein [Alphaproteobacteria bacterium]|nr:EAL domain-containing protein [Alphaproteobacteria bacterium]